jgi:HEPN domain-containing protein
MTEDFKNWGELAKEDLDQARYLQDGAFYRGACFSAQQATEKALKGALLRRGWELEKIHSVRRLVSIAAGFDLSLEIAPDDIDFIDSIYRGRYPAEEGLLPLTPPGKSEAKRAIRIAAEVLAQLGID